MTLRNRILPLDTGSTGQIRVTSRWILWALVKFV